MNTYLPNNNVQRPALPDSSEADYVYDGPEPEKAHLLDHWKVVVKHRRLLIWIFVIFLIVGAYFTFTATPLYIATAMLKIEPANPTVTGVTGVGEGPGRATEGGGPYDYYQTQYKLLQSRSLAARVIRDLGLDANKAFTSAKVTSSNPISRVQSWLLGMLNPLITPIAKLFEERGPDPEDSKTATLNKNASNRQETDQDTPAVSSGLVGKYLSFLQLNPIKNTRLVEVAFVTPNPALSQKLADAHIKGFIRMNLEGRFQLTKEARDFLDVKNTELKAKLEKSEAELNRFRQAHGVVSIDKGENIVVDRLVDLNRNLTTARAQRLEAESVNSVVQNKSTQYLSQVLTQGMIPTLRASLLGLEGEKIKQSTVFKPDHPRIIELNQQIIEATQALNAEINNVVRGIRENYVAARAKEQALEVETQKQQQAALNLKEVGVQFAVLQEEVNVNKNLYDSILKRLNETNISNDIAVSNMQIIQFAEKPRSPSAPNIPMNLVMYPAMGLFLGVGLAFLLEYLKPRLETPDHVWRAVDLNTFGVVPDLESVNRPFISYQPALSVKLLPKRMPQPLLKHKSITGKDLLVSHHPLSVFSESYKTIRTALLLSQPQTAHKIILITSPSPEEGKTATTLNLAIALVQDGFKVLVIDGDLRRGSCHIRFGIHNHRGLSNVLEGKISLEAAIQESSVAGLSILTRGMCPPNPSELLGTRKMVDSLTILRESFDFILIDSPPAIAVSDTAVLSRMADGVVLVFHAKKTTVQSARQVKERLDAIRAPTLGVVLNGINVKDPDYKYYRNYYGSHYSEPVVDDGDGISTTAIDTPAPAPELLAIKKPEPILAQSGTVPSNFFDLFVSKLRDAVGPMAPLILEDHIALLGEIRSSFPKSRLLELLDGISKEILNDNLKITFQRSMQEEIQSL